MKGTIELYRLSTEQRRTSLVGACTPIDLLMWPCRSLSALVDRVARSWWPSASEHPDLLVKLARKLKESPGLAESSRDVDAPEAITSRVSPICLFRAPVRVPSDREGALSAETGLLTALFSVADLFFEGPDSLLLKTRCEGPAAFLTRDSCNAFDLALVLTPVPIFRVELELDIEREDSGRDGTIRPLLAGASSSSDAASARRFEVGFIGDGGATR